MQAQNNVRAAILDLAQLLELPSWDGFSIVRTSPAPPSDVSLGHPDDIYADAVMDRPSIKAEELRLKGTEHSIEIAKSGYYPSLSLNAGLGTNYYSSFPTAGFWNQLGANFSQYVGLSLNIPIFNRFQVRNQVRSAKIQQEAQRVQLRRAQQGLYAAPRPAGTVQGDLPGLERRRCGPGKVRRLAGSQCRRKGCLLAYGSPL